MKLNGELNKREQALFIKIFKLMDKAAGVFIYVFAVMGILVSIALAMEFKQLLPVLTVVIMIVVSLGLIKLFQLYIRKLIKSIEETGTTWKGFFGKGKKP